MAGTGPRPGSDYYRGQREDLLRLVPELPTGRRVLELGCGEGRLGEQLRRRGLEVHGVELMSGPAAAAALVLDRVHCADLEHATLDYPDGHFDLLVCGDVLEHLRDPWAVLTRLRPLLRSGGAIVASVPNVQYFPVVCGLLRGRFDYRDAGVLDRTHLRFFTTRSARQLFEQAGFTIEAMPARFPYRRRWLRGLAWLLDRVSFGGLRGFLVGQVFVIARRLA